ncbi:MAG: hypothetical protein SFW64_01690 [Alphaproteobacteria bacterium]|nr:hypothetical protein [Alphaproteobacteria bacterium]
MKKIYLSSALATIAVGVLSASGALAAAKKGNEVEQEVFNRDGAKFKLSTGFDYSKGDYGQSADTEVWYVPVSGKLEVDDWTVKLTVPWLSIKGPGAVIGGGGGVVTNSSGAVTTESGLGDVVASLTYTANIASDTYLDLTTKVKLPTADEDRGLGTGETDYTVQADLSRQFGPLSLYTGAGYKFVGSNNTLNLDDIWIANVGFGYDVTKSVNAGLTYDWREAAASSTENPSEITAYVNVKATDRINVQLYGLTGFSDGSPNGGGGILAGYKF